MSLIHIEQTKLTATAVSNVAIAFGVAGFVAPLVAVSFGLASAPPAAPATVLASLVWLATAVALHLLARRVLRNIEP